jgi:glycosyltransferase involved in cell wall biosynthesis
MRIAMVSEHADPTAAPGGEDAGGQNVHVAALARALAARDHTITVYTRLASPGAEPVVHLAPGVEVRRLPAGPAAPLPKDELLPHMTEFGAALGREWARQPPDLVHAHFWMSGLASLQGAAGLPVPVAQTFHALGSVKARHQGAKDTSPPERIDAERRIGRDCDQVIATCHDEVRELGRLGVPSDKVSVVPCGVDTGTFWPFGTVAPRDSPGRLLTLGRLVERKGIDTAIEALAQLPGVELVVAGGPERDLLGRDTEYRRLRGIARDRGVADRVVFTGAVPRTQVPALIRSADIVVCTPWYEPFGITPLEAMACGVPVVASAVGGLTDSVVHGTTGLLIPARDGAALAAAAGTLLGDPKMRAAFGEAGARRARRWYSWPRVAAQTESVYLRLGAGVPPGRDTGRGTSLAVGAP